MRFSDPKAIDGKYPAIEDHADLLVIGAGAAGTAAALAAARAGAAVRLVDENPIDPALMGMDVPHCFGGRMSAAVQNRARMMERIALSDPALAEVFDAGVDVRLGTTAWALYAPEAESRAFPGLLAGIEDGSRAWLVCCDHVIVAAGARDFMLGFPGWDQAGVMGAQALHVLLHRYEALTAQRILFLGSGALALHSALATAERGIAVAGIVEPRAEAQGPAELLGQIAERNIPFFASHVIAAAAGGADGVSGAELVALDAAGAPLPDRRQRIACDTICLAIEQVPNIELLAALGCRMTFSAARGGWAPMLEGQRTNIARVQAAGDCAGLDGAEARAQGKAAAEMALADADSAAPTTIPAARAETWRDASVWLAALAAAAGHDVLCCRCESVTREDILGVRPPPYLNARKGRISQRGFASLLALGPPNQDQIKRLTRSGMGECQGRRCREQTTMMLAAGSGLAPSLIPLATYRAPVRPLPLGLMADDSEPAAMRAGWDAWFGIPSQWVPWWLIGSAGEGIDRDGGFGVEGGDTWHL